MSKDSYQRKFLVNPAASFKLTDIDPSDKGAHQDKKSAQEELKHYLQRLLSLQYLLYAEDRQSLLICLQALDAGGKDGTIRHVLGHMNPQGCRVHPFRVPTSEEAAHDFLWRAHRRAPARGEVVIFNRSHYEDVLVARVHELVPEATWRKRYDAINAFEKQLVDNGTHVLKFFLHISKDEQLQRFRKRLNDPNRHWKISEADYQERQYWDAYQQAYQDALSRCSTPWAPWFVIPANHKWYRNLMILKIVVEYLDALHISTPEPRVDIEELKKKYHV